MGAGEAADDEADVDDDELDVDVDDDELDAEVDEDDIEEDDVDDDDDEVCEVGESAEAAAGVRSHMNNNSSRHTRNASAHGAVSAVDELELELELDADADTPALARLVSKSGRSSRNPKAPAFRIHALIHARNEGELRCVGWCVRSV